MKEGRSSIFSEQNKSVSRQRFEYRKTERKQWRSDGRSAREYIVNFFGLQHLFDYIRTLPSHQVLDIGAGVTKAAFQLERSDIGKGLDFRATVLTKNPRINDFLGFDKTIVASGESLKKVDNESCGGCIACRSVSYSKAPQLVVEELARVLCSKGVFKGAFTARETTNLGHREYNPLDFGLLLKYENFGVESIGGLILGIKGASDAEARELLWKDIGDYQSQLEHSLLPEDV